MKANTESLKFIVCWVEKEKFQFSYCQSQAFSEIVSDSLAVCVHTHICTHPYIYIYIYIYIYGMERESSTRFGE